MIYRGSLLLVTLALGCVPAGPKPAAEHAKFVLENEPAGAVGVVEARDTIASEKEVVVVGRIGGVPDPWTPGRAVFMMSDPACLDAQDAHHCEGCAFCAKPKIDTHSLALVRFEDDEGGLLPIDPQQAFGLSKDETVVVRGRARLHKAGYLVVSATGLYRRR